MEEKGRTRERRDINKEGEYGVRIENSMGQLQELF